jgi:Tol biopolymer transport system component
MGRNSRGEMQLFVTDADGSNVTAVTDGAGELNIMPQWSGDGATLYFYQVRPSLTFRRLSLAGESRHHELVVCETASGQCRTLTPKHDRPLTTIAWSGDGTRLFFLRHTSGRVWGELTSVAVDGSAMKVHETMGPFERDFQMSMDVSPRDDIVFPICREGPHELWLARLR